MRVVHYLESLRSEQGGVVRAVCDLTTGLAVRGLSVSLLTCDDADLAAAWSASGGGIRPEVRVLAAPPLPGQPLPRPALRAVASYCLRGADVLHLHGMWTPSNLQLAGLARNAGIPYVVSTHGALDDWRMAQHEPRRRLYLHLLGRKLLAGAAAVHVTSAREQAQAAARLGGLEPATIPPVVDLRHFARLPAAPRPAARPGERPTTILFAGALDRAKGVELLLDAAALLAGHDLPFRLRVAGLGGPRYQRSLRVRARRLGLADRVEFLGFVPEVGRAALYQAADVSVLPCWHENNGFALFEALACGRPVVTTKGTATWRELEASGGAVIVEPAAEDVAAGITTVLGSAQQMGRRGRAWVLQHLEPARCAAPYQRLYERAVAAAPARTAAAPSAPAGTPASSLYASLRRMAKWPAKRRGKVSS